MTFAESLTSAIIWYVTVTTAGLVTFPLLFHVCRSLPDRGLSLYRPVGLAIIPLPAWIIGNLVGIPFNPLIIIASALFLGVPAWIYALTRSDIVSFLDRRRTRLLVYESVTLLLFFGYVVFRGYNPNISGTEKPMELAFLNAALYAQEIPVPDPWFAGEPINYYYFGYVALAAVAMVASISGEVAFNLGLATAFSLATVGGAGLAANLSELIGRGSSLRTAAAAVLGGFLLSFSGNLHAAFELIRAPRETLSAGWWDGVGWSSSRVIQDTGFPSDTARTVITEFPAFSWILGDLHPHVMALPWLVTAIALSVNLSITLAASKSPVRLALSAAGMGVGIGVLYSSNSWDVPIVAAVLVGLLVGQIGRIGWRTITISLLTVALVALGTTGPFALRYTSPTGLDDVDLSWPWTLIPGLQEIAASLGYVSWNRTSATDLFTVHGGFLILLAIVLLVGYRTILARRPLVLGVAGLSAIALALIAMLTSTPALLVLGVPILLIMLVLLHKHEEPGTPAGLVLVVIALVTLVATEFVFVKDPFGDRMNTVFKLSFQAWAILSVALGALIPDALATLRSRMSRLPLSLALGAIALTVVLISVYTPISVFRWTTGFHSWQGIDGTSAIERDQPNELTAIDWLGENTDPSEVVLEAPGCAYGFDNLLPHNRVSMLTGRPTVIGWDGHEFQWRRGIPEQIVEIGMRIEHVQQIYEAPSESSALMTRYGIRYIYVGSHEVSGYRRCEHGPPYAVPDDDVLREAGWKLAYQNDDVRIYIVPDQKEN